MIRLTFAIELGYEIADAPADFIFNVHAAHTPRQAVLAEAVRVSQPVATFLHADAVSGNRYLRLRGRPGPLSVRYDATVEITHHLESPALIEETAIARLPPEVLPFIRPSRYCPSDRLRRLAMREFGHLRQGYARVQAIRDWVRARTAFAPGVSTESTSAIDTLVEQAGICRDFAHLMIALCRALNLPARFVTGIDYGAAPELGPPDFHAYVEVFLGARWYLFDPTGISPPMGLVRIGTGRDAADVSFAMMFGAVKGYAPLITIDAANDPDNGITLPMHCADAVSTQDELALAP